MPSTKQGILNIIVGVSISLFNALTQFLSIYFVLQKFGAQFNGFARMMTSVSALFASAEGALGIATILLLVKPIIKGDWISANEIYSASKKNYRKGAWTALGLVIGISLLYPLYASIGGINNIFIADSWKHISVSLVSSTGTTGSAEYWELLIIAIAIGFKNFATAFFFAVYENIITADNRSTLQRITVLFSDTLIFGLFLGLLTVPDVSPTIPYLVILTYSPIKGLMCYFYVRKKYPWLKYYRDFNNFKLNVMTKKISAPTIGISLLQNVDIIIASIFFGLDVSSDLSLYLIIGMNLRLIMVNFITSFREFFISLIAKNGRIHWKSYVKYELYVYIIAGFTFINMTILTPYFVSALYGDVARVSLQNDITNPDPIATSKALNFIFTDFRFSGIFAASTAISLMSESQMTLIQAKGQTGEVAKFQNWNGVIYFVLAATVGLVFGIVKIGGEEHLVYGIMAFYGLKVVFQMTRYLYLWIFVWRYVTYNSNFTYILQNLLNLLASFVGTIVIVILLYNRLYDVYNYTKNGSQMAPLVEIFFATLGGSVLFIFLISFVIEPKLFIGIARSLPVINELFKKRTKAQRKKRLEDNDIDLSAIIERDDIVAGISMDQFSNLDNSIDEQKSASKTRELVYKIKG